MPSLQIERPTEQQQPAERESWLDYIRGRILWDWRPGEFDPETLLYVPDPEREDTYISLCSRQGCGIRVQSRFCPSCLYERKRLESELGDRFDLDEWISTPRPRRERGTSCAVVGCQRTLLTVGLCASHRSAFFGWRKRTGETSLDEWILQRKPKPFPPAERKCRALICGMDAQGAHGLCDPHEGRWRQWKRRQGLPASELISVDTWLNQHFELPVNADQRFNYSELAATPFHLLKPSIRWEFLFALQQRDIELRTNMIPLSIRRAYQGLRNTELETLVGQDMLTLEAAHSNVAGLYRDLQMRIDEAHRQWLGVDGRERGLYFLTDLDLNASVKQVSRTATIDLRELKVSWWAEAVDSFLLEAGPHGRNLVRNTAGVARVVDTVLHQRGTPAEALGRFDMDAVVKAIRKRWTSRNGQRNHLGALRNVMTFARLSDDFLPIWRRIPSSFVLDPQRHAPAGTPPGGKDADDSFRYVPQPIVDWLMDHLHLLTRNSPLKTMEAQMMVYMHERCGRRTVETVRLKDDCITYDSAGQAYLEWERAKAPYGKGTRLPIHQDVHDAVRQWQVIKNEYGISSEWLFPSDFSRRDLPRHPSFLRDRIGDLVNAVLDQAPFHREVEGADGNLVYFDLRTIDAYSFRHAFAQRHADAEDKEGRPSFTPEELQEWMGHRSFDTTMNYFLITSRRKRHVMAALPSRRLNFLGQPVVIDRERDAFSKIAVSLGSCTEPVNVAAGDSACALDHACESCPFFLVDPFERDGLAPNRSSPTPRRRPVNHGQPEILRAHRVQVSVEKRQAVLFAIDDTSDSSELVSVASIARRAGVSRAFIHNHADLRDRVRSLAAQHSRAQQRIEDEHADLHEGRLADRSTLMAQVLRQRKKIETLSSQVEALELARSRHLGEQLQLLDESPAVASVEALVTSERLTSDNRRLQQDLDEALKLIARLRNELAGVRQALAEVLSESHPDVPVAIRRPKTDP